MLTTFSNAATTTSVSGYQAYGPYGNTLASSGSMSTAKGFTGQYQDPMGLDYYNARYYDPVIGCFISADTKQGHAQSMDPYAYVNGNPETLSDPTGQTVTHCHEPGDCGPGSYTTDVSGGDTGPVQSICIYSCYVGSGGSNSSGGCTGSCDDGAYHLPPQLNSSRPTSGGNPKIMASTLAPKSICDQRCGNDDRKFIKDYFADQKAYAANVSTAIGDGAALIGDIVSTVLHYLAQDWAGFAWELASTILRAAALIGDLGKLKILSLPPMIADILSGLKWVASLMDILSGAFGWANPLTGTVNLFGKWVINRVKLQAASVIAQYIASAASGAGTIAYPNFVNAPNWDNQSNAVDSYSNQHAHDVCVQFYPSANLCQ